MARPSPRMRLTSPSPSTPVTPRGGSPLLSPSSGAGSPSTPSRSGGPSENTYQRTFRAILKNAALIYTNCNTLTSKLDDSMARIERLRVAAKDRPTGTDASEIRAKRHKQFKAIEEEQIYLLEQYEKMVNQVDQLRKNSKKAEELLLEMSKRKGFEAAFADPLFLTWPLARFVDALSAFADISTLELDTYKCKIGKATSDSGSEHVLDESATEPITRVWASRKREFMEICEVELTPLTAGNG